MQFLGSIIYVTSAFYSLERVVSLVHWTHSFLYFYSNAGLFPFQDGMFHRKMSKKLEKVRIDKQKADVI